MLQALKERLVETLKTIAPLIGVALALQAALAPASPQLLLQFLVGSILVTVGMLLLFVGIDLGILPMGRFIGAELPRRRSVALIVAVGFAMGFATTVAEPDVLILAEQVERASQGGMSGALVRYVIAVGVAVFVAVAMARIVYGVSMRLLVAASLFAVLLLSFVAPADFVPLAYDAGSVTTGVLTAPVVLALAAGLSSVLAGRSAMSDGFGLLGLASIGPIIAVMIMGIALR